MCNFRLLKHSQGRMTRFLGITLSHSEAMLFETLNGSLLDHRAQIGPNSNVSGYPLQANTVLFFPIMTY